MGALDFAGGTVVHVNAATAALVAAVVIGQRKDYARQAILPHNVPFTLLGAGLLWFGWFGFNAGSALGGERDRRPRLREHHARPRRRRSWSGRCSTSSATGKATAVGAATGIVVGLVAITPAAGFIGPLPALALGGIGGRSQLLRARLARAHAARRLARRGRRPRPRRHGGRAPHGRLRLRRPGTAPSTACCYGNPGQLRHPGDRGARGDRLQRGRQLRPAQGHRACVTPLKVRHARGGARPRREPARRGGLRRRRRRRSHPAAGRERRAGRASPRSPPRRRKEVAREARGGDRAPGEGSTTSSRPCSAPTCRA